MRPRPTQGQAPADARAEDPSKRGCGDPRARPYPEPTSRPLRTRSRLRAAVRAGRRIRRTPNCHLTSPQGPRPLLGMACDRTTQPSPPARPEGLPALLTNSTIGSVHKEGRPVCVVVGVPRPRSETFGAGGSPMGAVPSYRVAHHRMGGLRHRARAARHARARRSGCPATAPRTRGSCRSQCWHWPPATAVSRSRTRPGGGRATVTVHPPGPVAVNNAASNSQGVVRRTDADVAPGPTGATARAMDRRPGL